MKVKILLTKDVVPNDILNQERERFEWVTHLPDDSITVSPEMVLSPLASWDVVRRARTLDFIAAAPLNTWEEVYNLWYAVKFLCQEIHDHQARSLGRRLAQQEDDDFEVLRDEMVKIVYQPSSPSRIKGWFLKAMAHERKQHPDVAIFQDVIEDTSEAGIYSGIQRMEEYTAIHNLFFQLEPYTKQREVI